MSRGFCHHDCSFQVRAIERLYLVERYFVEVVVEVGVIGAGDNQQLLVVAVQFLVGVLAEVARMGFLPVDEQHGIAYFACV